MKQVKTDVVEIFQTIRASLQPYAVMGFDNRENSETAYDLWSNRNVVMEGEQKHEVFFASVLIEDDHVTFRLMPDDAGSDPELRPEPVSRLFGAGRSGSELKELDETLLSEIESALAEGFRIFKEKAWV